MTLPTERAQRRQRRAASAATAATAAGVPAAAAAFSNFSWRVPAHLWLPVGRLPLFLSTNDLIATGISLSSLRSAAVGAEVGEATAETATAAAAVEAAAIRVRGAQAASKVGSRPAIAQAEVLERSSKYSRAEASSVRPCSVPLEATTSSPAVHAKPPAAGAAAPAAEVATAVAASFVSFTQLADSVDSRRRWLSRLLTHRPSAAATGNVVGADFRNEVNATVPSASLSHIATGSDDPSCFSVLVSLCGRRNTSSMDDDCNREEVFAAGSCSSNSLECESDVRGYISHTRINDQGSSNCKESNTCKITALGSDNDATEKRGNNKEASHRSTSSGDNTDKSSSGINTKSFRTRHIATSGSGGSGCNGKRSDVSKNNGSNDDIESGESIMRSNAIPKSSGSNDGHTSRGRSDLGSGSARSGYRWDAFVDEMLFCNCRRGGSAAETDFCGHIQIIFVVWMNLSPFLCRRREGINPLFHTQLTLSSQELFLLQHLLPLRSGYISLPLLPLLSPQQGQFCCIARCYGLPCSSVCSSAAASITAPCSAAAAHFGANNVGQNHEHLEQQEQQTSQLRTHPDRLQQRSLKQQNQQQQLQQPPYLNHNTSLLHNPLLPSCVAFSTCLSEFLVYRDFVLNLLFQTLNESSSFKNSSSIRNSSYSNSNCTRNSSCSSYNRSSASYGPSSSNACCSAQMCKCRSCDSCRSDMDLPASPCSGKCHRLNSEGFSEKNGGSYAKTSESDMSDLFVSGSAAHSSHNISSFSTSASSSVEECSNFNSFDKESRAHSDRSSSQPCSTRKLSVFEPAIGVAATSAVDTRHLPLQQSPQNSAEAEIRCFSEQQQLLPRCGCLVCACCVSLKDVRLLHASSPTDGAAEKSTCKNTESPIHFSESVHKCLPTTSTGLAFVVGSAESAVPGGGGTEPAEAAATTVSLQTIYDFISDNAWQLRVDGEPSHSLLQFLQGSRICTFPLPKTISSTPPFPHSFPDVSTRQQHIQLSGAYSLPSTEKHRRCTDSFPFNSQQKLVPKSHTDSIAVQRKDAATVCADACASSTPSEADLSTVETAAANVSLQQVASLAKHQSETSAFAEVTDCTAAIVNADPATPFAAKKVEAVFGVAQHIIAAESATPPSFSAATGTKECTKAHAAVAECSAASPTDWTPREAEESTIEVAAADNTPATEDFGVFPDAVMCRCCICQLSAEAQHTMLACLDATSLAAFAVTNSSHFLLAEPVVPGLPMTVGEDFLYPTAALLKELQEQHMQRSSTSSNAPGRPVGGLFRHQTHAFLWLRQRERRHALQSPAFHNTSKETANLLCTLSKSLQAAGAVTTPSLQSVQDNAAPTFCRCLCCCSKKFPQTVPCNNAMYTESAEVNFLTSSAARDACSSSDTSSLRYKSSFCDETNCASGGVATTLAASRSVFTAEDCGSRSSSERGRKSRGNSLICITNKEYGYTSNNSENSADIASTDKGMRVSRSQGSSNRSSSRSRSSGSRTCSGREASGSNNISDTPINCRCSSHPEMSQQVFSAAESVMNSRLEKDDLAPPAKRRSDILCDNFEPQQQQGIWSSPRHHMRPSVELKDCRPADDVLKFLARWTELHLPSASWLWMCSSPSHSSKSQKQLPQQQLHEHEHEKGKDKIEKTRLCDEDFQDLQHSYEKQQQQHQLSGKDQLERQHRSSEAEKERQHEAEQQPQAALVKTTQWDGGRVMAMQRNDQQREEPAVRQREGQQPEEKGAQRGQRRKKRLSCSTNLSANDTQSLPKRLSQQNAEKEREATDKSASSCDVTSGLVYRLLVKEDASLVCYCGDDPAEIEITSLWKRQAFSPRVVLTRVVSPLQAAASGVRAPFFQLSPGATSPVAAAASPLLPAVASGGGSAELQPDHVLTDLPAEITAGVSLNAHGAAHHGYGPCKYSHNSSSSSQPKNSSKSSEANSSSQNSSRNRSHSETGRSGGSSRSSKSLISSGSAAICGSETSYRVSGNGSCSIKDGAVVDDAVTSYTKTRPTDGIAEEGAQLKAQACFDVDVPFGAYSLYINAEARLCFLGFSTQFLASQQQKALLTQSTRSDLLCTKTSSSSRNSVSLKNPVFEPGKEAGSAGNQLKDVLEADPDREIRNTKFCIRGAALSGWQQDAACCCQQCSSLERSQQQHQQTASSGESSSSLQFLSFSQKQHCSTPKAQQQQQPQFLDYSAAQQLAHFNKMKLLIEKQRAQLSALDCNISLQEKEQRRQRMQQPDIDCLMHQKQQQQQLPFLVANAVENVEQQKHQQQPQPTHQQQQLSSTILRILDRSALGTEGGGGLFCDEPGLGKTLVMLALTVKTKARLPRLPLLLKAHLITTIAAADVVLHDSAGRNLVHHQTGDEGEKDVFAGAADSSCENAGDDPFVFNVDRGNQHLRRKSKGAVKNASASISTGRTSSEKISACRFPKSAAALRQVLSGCNAEEKQVEGSGLQSKKKGRHSQGKSKAVHCNHSKCGGEMPEGEEQKAEKEPVGEGRSRHAGHKGRDKTGTKHSDIAGMKATEPPKTSVPLEYKKKDQKQSLSESRDSAKVVLQSQQRDLYAWKLDAQQIGAFLDKNGVHSAFESPQLNPLYLPLGAREGDNRSAEKSAADAAAESRKGRFSHLRYFYCYSLPGTAGIHPGLLDAAARASPGADAFLREAPLQQLLQQLENKQLLTQADIRATANEPNAALRKLKRLYRELCSSLKNNQEDCNALLRGLITQHVAAQLATAESARRLRQTLGMDSPPCKADPTWTNASSCEPSIVSCTSSHSLPASPYILSPSPYIHSSRSFAQTSPPRSPSTPRGCTKQVGIPGSFSASTSSVSTPLTLVGDCADGFSGDLAVSAVPLKADGSSEQQLSQASENREQQLCYSENPHLLEKTERSACSTETSALDFPSSCEKTSCRVRNRSVSCQSAAYKLISTNTCENIKGKSCELCSKETTGDFSFARKAGQATAARKEFLCSETRVASAAEVEPCLCSTANEATAAHCASPQNTETATATNSSLHAFSTEEAASKMLFFDSVDLNRADQADATATAGASVLHTCCGLEDSMQLLAATTDEQLWKLMPVTDAFSKVMPTTPPDFVLSSATLVVCPAALLGHWQSEVKKWFSFAHCKEDDRLKVLVLEQKKNTPMPTRFELAACHLVLCSQSFLTSEFRRCLASDEEILFAQNSATFDSAAFPNEAAAEAFATAAEGVAAGLQKNMLNGTEAAAVEFCVLSSAGKAKTSYNFSQDIEDSLWQRCSSEVADVRAVAKTAWMPPQAFKSGSSGVHNNSAAATESMKGESLRAQRLDDEETGSAWIDQDLLTCMQAAASGGDNASSFPSYRDGGHTPGFLRDLWGSVSSSGTFKRNRSQLLSIHWQRVVVDEGHALSRTSSNYVQLCRMIMADKRWVMTGTPTSTQSLERSLSDLTSLFEFLHHPLALHYKYTGQGAAKASALKFSICRPLLEKSSTAALFRLTLLLNATLVRHTKKQCQRLPPLRGPVIYRIEPSKKERETYNDLVQLTQRNLYCTYYSRKNKDSLLHSSQRTQASTSLWNLRFSCTITSEAHLQVLVKWIDEAVQMLANKHPIYHNEFPYNYQLSRVLHVVEVFLRLNREGRTYEKCDLCLQAIRFPLLVPCPALHLLCTECLFPQIFSHSLCKRPPLRHCPKCWPLFPINPDFFDRLQPPVEHNTTFDWPYKTHGARANAELDRRSLVFHRQRMARHAQNEENEENPFSASIGLQVDDAASRSMLLSSEADSTPLLPLAAYTLSNETSRPFSGFSDDVGTNSAKQLYQCTAGKPCFSRSRNGLATSSSTTACSRTKRNSCRVDSSCSRNNDSSNNNNTGNDSYSCVANSGENKRSVLASPLTYRIVRKWFRDVSQLTAAEEEQQCTPTQRDFHAEDERLQHNTHCCQFGLQNNFLKDTMVTERMHGDHVSLQTANSRLPSRLEVGLPRSCMSSPILHGDGDFACKNRLLWSNNGAYSGRVTSQSSSYFFNEDGDQTAHQARKYLCSYYVEVSDPFTFQVDADHNADPSFVRKESMKHLPKIWPCTASHSLTSPRGLEIDRILKRLPAHSPPDCKRAFYVQSPQARQATHYSPSCFTPFQSGYLSPSYLSSSPLGTDATDVVLRREALQRVSSFPFHPLQCTSTATAAALPSPSQCIYTATAADRRESALVSLLLCGGMAANEVLEWAQEADIDEEDAIFFSSSKNVLVVRRILHIIHCGRYAQNNIPDHMLEPLHQQSECIEGCSNDSIFCKHSSNVETGLHENSFAGTQKPIEKLKKRVGFAVSEQDDSTDKSVNEARNNYDKSLPNWSFTQSVTSKEEERNSSPVQVKHGHSVKRSALGDVDKSGPLHNKLPHKACKHASHGFAGKVPSAETQGERLREQPSSAKRSILKEPGGSKPFLRKVQRCPKIIVASSLWENLFLLGCFLEKHKIRCCHFYEKMHQKGGRAANLNRFQHDSETVVLLLSTHLGAHGLDLSCASHVLLLDPPTDPNVEQQVISRAHRMGSLRDVHVEIFILKDTVEEAILQLRRIWTQSEDSVQKLESRNTAGGNSDFSRGQSHTVSNSFLLDQAGRTEDSLRTSIVMGTSCGALPAKQPLKRGKQLKKVGGSCGTHSHIRKKRIVNISDDTRRDSLGDKSPLRWTKLCTVLGDSINSSLVTLGPQPSWREMLEEAAGLGEGLQKQTEYLLRTLRTIRRPAT